MTLLVDNGTIEGLLRSRSWSADLTTQVLSNSTLQLLATSAFHQAFTGNTSGQIVKMPNATTLNNGHKFEMFNLATSAQIMVKDFANGPLFTAVYSSVIRLTLIDNSTQAGLWATSSVQVGTASGIVNYKAVASAAFTPALIGDAVVTGMSITPITGTYAVWYDGSCQITVNTNTLTTSIYNGATQITDSTRDIGTSGVSTFNTTHQSKTVAQFNGANACEVHVSRTAGTLTVTGRSLILIRLGD